MDLTQLHLPPARFDAIICCAVLHFAHDEDHFFRMTDELLRVLKPMGSLFIRMNASLTDKINLLSDEEPRFLLTPPIVEQLMERYSLEWLEPQRIEIINQTARSTLVMKKLA